MSVRHLLRTPGHRPLAALVLAALAASAVFVFAFGLIHRPLGRYTILDLEFTWGPERLRAMTREWGPAGDAAARLSLWVDFLFMPAYALLFAGLTVMAARAASGRAQTLGLWLAAAPFLAWGADALENISLLGTLPPAEPDAAALTVAGTAAAVKFGLLLACLVYVLVISIARRLARRPS